MNPHYLSVTIIVVNYNGIRYLRECFSSLMKLEYPKDLLEYILVDNGSEDRSLEYIESRFPDVRILRNNQNNGFAKANNQAAKTAKGEILAFLNNDMKVHPLWLRKLIDKLRTSAEDLVCVSSRILSYEGNKVDFIGGGFTPFGVSFQVDFGKSLKEIEGGMLDTEKDLLFGCGGAMAIKRNVFLESGGFDEDYFAYLEDVDLGWRLRIMGYRIMYVPESVVFHRHRGTGRKIPSHQLEFMFERNRFLTIIKNTEDVYLPYFLSMVCMFNVNRTHLASRNNFMEFHFVRPDEKEVSFRRNGGEETSQSLMTKLRVMWKKKDFGILWRWSVAKIIKLIKRLTGYQFVHQRTLSYAAAFNSIIPELNCLITKRKEIQSKRKISDRQIFPLFLMDEYLKQDIGSDSALVIERIMKFEKEMMKRGKVYFPE